MSQTIRNATWNGAEYAISVNQNKREIYISDISDRMNAGGWTDSAFLKENLKASNQEIIIYVMHRYLSDIDPVCNQARSGKTFKDLLKRCFGK